MNLKIRSALLFSFFVFIILMISAGFIYFQNENFRIDDFRKRLHSNAQESFKIYSKAFDSSDVNLLDYELSTVGSLPNQKVAIFDNSFVPIFASPSEFSSSITKNEFRQLSPNEDMYFSRNGYDFLLLHAENNNKKFIVAVAATDVYGKRKIENLKLILAFTVVGGLILSGLLAFLYVRQLVKPLVNLQNQMALINEQNLTERVSEGKSRDEVSMIAKNFNSMLDRLEQAFEMRKSFVQHASHELRTPLASMLAQTEAALSQQLTQQQYHTTLQSLKEDQQNMIDLTNSLLLLSRYQKLPILEEGSQLRIDELIYDSIESVVVSNPGSVINLDYENVPENDNYLVVNGNEALIKSAVQNLIRNASQYSFDKKVDIKILGLQHGITVKFENKGRQLSPQEQESLFIPFFRGENSMQKKGYGLGLSIVHRIMTIHGGTIMYEARFDDINRFTIYFPANRSPI